MDGRRMEREGERARYPKREEKEGRERGGGGGGGSRRRNDNKQHIYIYINPHAISLPSSSSTNITFSKKPSKSNPTTPKTNLPKKCNSSPSSPPQPSQPLPLRSSRPGVERKSALVEHHIVANWTFWASLLFLARMVSCTYLLDLVEKSNQLSETLTIFFFLSIT